MMSRPLRHTAAVCAAALLTGLLGACAGSGARASHGPPGAPIAWPEHSDAYAALARLRDAEQPSPTPRTAPPIRGLDTASLAPIAPDDPAAENARLPLDQVLDTLRLSRPLAGVTTPPTPPTEGALVRAQRFYASGLAKLLDADPAGAARDLAAAAQLDPTTPAPWLRLAEAQSMMGQNAAAMLSRRKAADLGADDPVLLGILGIQTARTGQSDLAAYYLSRCLDAEPEKADPLLRPVALVCLADPLAQAGYLQASIDALQAGLELPHRLNAPTRFADEAADIARRASDLWVQIGDTACRLGDDALAAEAYATASNVPSVDPGAILARRAFVLLRSGRPASVALLTLDDIAGREGRADTRDRALLALLRDDRELGPLLARALDDLDDSIAPNRTATTDTLLTLAKAAASPDDRARRLLAGRAAEAPADPRVLDALFARCAGPEAIKTEALRLVAQSPDASPAIAKAMLPWHPAPGPLCAALPGTPEGRLLRVNLLLALDRPADAAAAPLPDEGNAFAEARAAAAARAGQWDRLDRLLPALDASPPAKARVLKAAQRLSDALDALTPALAEPDTPIGVLLLGAELALNTGDTSRAADLLERAHALDPFDERVYEGLINVRQVAGDAQGAGEAIRELRQRSPSSHLLRWVNAQEEARRGLLDQAERSARELVEDSADNAGPLGLLLTIWAQRNSVGDTGSLENASEWLAGLIANPPVTGEMLAAHATLLDLLGRTDQAEQLLRDAYKSRPTPQVSRTLENLLRAGDRADEADALAEERLAASGAGIDASLERAENAARAKQWDRIVPAALDAMPERARLSPGQERRILLLAGLLAGRVQSADSQGDLGRDALALLDAAEARGVGLDWQLSYTRWALLAGSDDSTTDQIVGATESFLQKIPTTDVANRIIGDTASRLGVAVDNLDQARAQIAYQLAGNLFATGRDDASLGVYRIALRYNPDHAWAANDLGYFLLERAEDLDTAEQLLEHAFALKPNQSNIADSLGWLRYKRGELDNRKLPDGKMREGAVSLLIAATGLPGGADNATVHDHLGDALWRSGDHDRAEAEWVRAQQLLVGQLAALKDGGSSPRRDELTKEASGVGAKLDALRDGREPPVAPLIHE